MMDVTPKSPRVPHNEMTCRALLLSFTSMVRFTKPPSFCSVDHASVRMSTADVVQMAGTEADYCGMAVMEPESSMRLQRLFLLAAANLLDPGLEKLDLVDSLIQWRWCSRLAAA